MLKYLKQRIAVRRWIRSPLGQALDLHKRDYFYGETALRHFRHDRKEKLVGDFYQKVGTILMDESPMSVCRHQLAEYTLAFTHMQVLCLKEFEKADQFYAGNPYISGTLWHHIHEASEHNEELARFKWETPDLTDEELIEFANVRCALYLYYANGMNIVRRDLGDMSEEKDWFRPFVESCLINEEHILREKLGMPILVPGMLGSLPYASFLDHVLNGERNPFYSWTHTFPDLYLAGEGPPPQLATHA